MASRNDRLVPVFVRVVAWVCGTFVKTFPLGWRMELLDRYSSPSGTSFRYCVFRDLMEHVIENLVAQ